MNAERLLAQFERVADAPDAVARLRKLVLDLAIRGKLVAQNPKDEPVQQLLNSIQSEKVQLSNEGKLRGSFTVEPLDMNDAPFFVPTSWVWVPFGQLVVSRDGERVSVSKEERNTRGKVYDYYGASGVIDKIDSYLFDKPLLLIGEDGANLINRSTPIAFIARGKYWVNNHAHVLDGISEDFLRFIELFINATDLKPYVTGTAQPKMNQAKMNSIPVAVPPRAEQRRIVAKVDELMAVCDRLEAAQAQRESRRDRLVSASLHRLNQPAEDAIAFHDDARFALDHLARFTTRPEHIPQLRQTILNLAVRGKLVAQDPKEEPAPSFGIENNSDRRDRLALEAPPGWSWARAADVADARLGKMLDKAKNSGKAYPYLRNTNVHWFDIRLDELKSMRIEDSEIANFLLKKGDVLICEGGHGIGRTAVWRGQQTGIVFQKALHRVRSGPSLCGDYFSYCVFVYFHAAILQTYYTGVGIPHFTGVALSKLVFPLPPLAEQHRIVARVDELMALCDRLEAQLTTTQRESRQLLEVVLHEALAV